MSPLWTEFIINDNPYEKESNPFEPLELEDCDDFIPEDLDKEEADLEAIDIRKDF
jgi:hypothetical protein